MAAPLLLDGSVPTSTTPSDGTDGTGARHVAALGAAPTPTVGPDHAAVAAFLQRLAAALIAFGCSTSRTEHKVRLAAVGLGMNSDVAAFPNWFIMRTFKTPPRMKGGRKTSDTVLKDVRSSGTPPPSHDGTAASYAQAAHDIAVAARADAMTMRSVPNGLDASKLELTEGLADEVSSGKLGPHEADDKLVDVVDAGALYSRLWQQLSFIVCGASCTLLFYGGGFVDSAVSGVLGGVVGFLCWAANTYDFGGALDFLSAFVVAVVARSMATYLLPNDMCFFASALGALVWMFPGLSITTSVMEISSGSPIAGVARLVGALFTALTQGFGLALGSRLGNLGARLGTYSCNTQQQWYVQVPAFLGVFFSFAILLNSSKKQLRGMMVTNIVGYIVPMYAPGLVGPDAATVVSAAFIAMAAGINHRVTGEAEYVPTISGILFLVPGSFGVRGAAAIVDSDYVSGTQFGITMILTAAAITIGIAIGRAVVRPAGGAAHVAARHFRWFMTPKVSLSKIARMTTPNHVERDHMLAHATARGAGGAATAASAKPAEQV